MRRKDELMEKCDAKDFALVTVNNDGTFGTIVSQTILDIDFCYTIDCLKTRRRMMNESHD